MSRQGWVLTWQLAVLLAGLAVFRLIGLGVSAWFGHPHPWLAAATVVYGAAAAALAWHANRRRKALPFPGLGPPPPDVP